MPADTPSPELDLSIESLKQLYYSAVVPPAAVVRKVYSRIAAHNDKAVWITLVPEQDAIERAESLLLQYPNESDR